MTTQDEDETASQAFSVNSDAAVAVPQVRSSSRMSTAPRLSFGNPSKAVLAALSAAAESEDEIDEDDLQALLPNQHPPPASPAAKAKRRSLPSLLGDEDQLKRNSTQSPKRNPALKLPQFKRSATAGSHSPKMSPFLSSKQNNSRAFLSPNNRIGRRKPDFLGTTNFDDDEDDFLDDDSDCAVAVPKPLLGQIGTLLHPHTGASKAAAGLLASLEESEHPRLYDDEEEDIEALLPAAPHGSSAPPKPPTRRHDNKKTRFGSDDGDEAKAQATMMKKKKKLISKKNSFEMSSRTGTSRTASVGFSDASILDRTDYMDRTDHTDARSTTSRYTSRSHRTLKEIRAEKNNATMMDKSDKSHHSQLSRQQRNKNTWCCGLNKWTWIAILVTGLVGFGVGFVMPFVRSLQKPDPVEVASATDDGLYQDYEPDMGDTVPPAGVSPSDTDLPPTEVQPSSPEGVKEAEGEGSAIIEEEPPNSISYIDVWQLFGTNNEVLPQASAGHLAHTAEFRQDHLEQAARLFVQGTLQRNVRHPKVSLQTKKQSALDEEEYVVPFVDTPRQAFDGEVPYPTARTSDVDQYPQGDVARWEDLLERLKIQESDSVQWDRENNVLYMARGKYIEVIDTQTGSIRVTIPLPQAQSEEPMMTREEWLMPLESDGWKPAPPEPFIEQLLLTTKKDYLLVIVSDYSTVHQAKVKPLLKDSLVTKLYTFQMAHLQDKVTQYQLVDQPHAIHGRVLYAAQATTNQHIHVVTSSSIDTARLLQDPLERLYYPDQHDSVYVDEVLSAAQDRYIPLYVKRLIDEIDGLEGDLSLLPVTQWIAGEGARTEGESHLEHVVSAQKHLQELVVVTSFSIVETNDPSATATLRQAGSTTMTGVSTAAISTAFLGPASMQVLGSTDTHLTLSVPGHEWIVDSEDGKVLEEATHVLQWELGILALPGASTRAATRFQAMGTIPGRLVQTPRQSTNRHGGDLRLATVLTSRWQVGDSPGGELANTQPIVERLVHKSFVHVLSQRTLKPRSGSPLELFKEEGARLASVTFMDSVAYAFPLQPASVLANQVGIQVVQLPIDHEDELSTTLEVDGSISPVPFGFSSHLHKLASQGDGRRLLLSIGHNTTDSTLLQNGWVLTVWDASDRLAPKIVVQRSLEEENTLTTWKPQTFRVTPNGLVIFPMAVEYIATRNREENMQGFVVLDVSGTEVRELTEVEIKELIRVPHSEVVMSAGECVQGMGNCGFEGKSLWSEGTDGLPSLLTVEGSTVKLTKLDSDGTSEGGWSLSLP